MIKREIFENLGDFINENNVLIDIIPTTGLLIKYYPTIGIIYFGFGLLLTACLSYTIPKYGSSNNKTILG
jgi:hypothetical protein